MVATKAAVRAKNRATAKPGLSKVHDRVLAWFDEHGRSFPWREHRDPYQTLVAEVMLQQTQTGRVAPAYGSFLAKFPTVSSLAHAPAMEVIQAWRGLGYNRRAVDLQRSAQVSPDSGHTSVPTAFDPAPAHPCAELRPAANWRRQGRPQAEIASTARTRG